MSSYRTPTQNSYSSSDRGGGPPFRGWRGGRGGRGGSRSFNLQREDRSSHHQRLENRQAPLPVPSDAYLSATLLPSTTLPLDAPLPADHPAPIVVLSLNQSLIYRRFRTARGATQPCVRPYLSTFLEYVCGMDRPQPGETTSTADRTRFRPVVYSAMRGPNLINLLRAINLVPDTHLPPPPSSTNFRHTTGSGYDQYEPDFELGDVLSAVLSRESMGLDEADYEADVQATKDLSKVLEKLDLTGSGDVDDLATALSGLSVGAGSSQSGGRKEEKSLEELGARSTVLLDDEVVAAAQFPFSLLRVTPFIPSSPTAASTTAHPSGAVSLPASHPSGSDTHLLALIYLLHLLRHESNVAGALRDGFVERVENETRRKLEDAEDGAVSEEDVQRALADRGRQVCRLAGIEVSREWKPRWREDMLEKEERE